MHLAYAEENGLWTVTITPTQRQLAQFIQKITLHGGDRLSFWAVEYTDGTRIETDLIPTDQDFSDEISC